MLRVGLHDALETVPQFSVVGDAATGTEAVRMALEWSPDVILLDFGLPDINGAEATRRILADKPSVKVLIFSCDASRASVTASLEAGAHGYLTKGSTLLEIRRAIETALAGSTYLSPEATHVVFSETTSALHNPEISPEWKPRDRQLLHLIAEGLRNKEIADELKISIKTVEACRSRLMKRLNCSNAAELVRYAIREGLVKA